VGDEQADARHDGTSGIRVGHFFIHYTVASLPKFRPQKPKEPKKKLRRPVKSATDLGQIIPAVGLR
jgi:hypothetical protein